MSEVHIIMESHVNGTYVVDVFGSMQDAEDIMGELEKCAMDEGDVVDYFIESYNVR